MVCKRNEICEKQSISDPISPMDRKYDVENAISFDRVQSSMAYIARGRRSCTELFFAPKGVNSSNLLFCVCKLSFSSSQ